MAPESTRGTASIRRLLIDAARPHARQFAVIALLAVLATGFDLLQPLVYRTAVNDIAGLFVSPSSAASSPLPGLDRLLPSWLRDIEPHKRGQVSARTREQAFATLLWAVALLFGIDIASQAFSLLADQRSARVSNRIENDLILRTFARVLRLPLSFFDARASGGLAKQIDQSDQVTPIVRAFSREVAPEVLRMVGVIAIMMGQSWELTLTALVTLPPYLWVVRRSSARLESGATRYYEMWESVSARIQDALGAIKTVKLSGAEQRESRALERVSAAALETQLERNRLANIYLFWQYTLSFASNALVLGYGGWLVLEHQLTPGDVVMFVAYLDKLFSPIESMTSLSVTLQENLASVRRAAQLLADGRSEGRGAELAPGPGRVVFREVRFSYRRGREVLKGLSLELAPGEVTALVGPSGAGKTTASDLLLRLFEPDSGEIWLDGQPLSALDPAAVRRAIAVVAADGAIFRGTLADNIRYKRPDASDDEVRAAAATAGLARTLERLPDGLATEIGERGVGLSVGERQRLQIARALVSQPRVLILDEATANLDYATESEIRRSLWERPKRPTTLVIAHRFSMVEHADRVYVLDGGRVVEAGSVAELSQAGGWFSRFAASARDAHGEAPPAGAQAHAAADADDEHGKDDAVDADEGASEGGDATGA